MKKDLFVGILLLTLIGLSYANFQLRKTKESLTLTGFQILDSLRVSQIQFHQTDSLLKLEQQNHWLDTVDGYPPKYH